MDVLFLSDQHHGRHDSRKATWCPRARVDIGRSAIGVGVRAGAKRPDISTVEALTKTFLDAKSIAVSAQISGTYLTIGAVPQARYRRTSHVQSPARRERAGWERARARRSRTRRATNLGTARRERRGLRRAVARRRAARVRLRSGSITQTKAPNPTGARAFVESRAVSDWPGRRFEKADWIQSRAEDSARHDRPSKAAVPRSSSAFHEPKRSSRRSTHTGRMPRRQRASSATLSGPTKPDHLAKLIATWYRRPSHGLSAARSHRGRLGGLLPHCLHLRPTKVLRWWRCPPLDGFVKGPNCTVPFCFATVCSRGKRGSGGHNSRRPVTITARQSTGGTNGRQVFFAF